MTAIGRMAMDRFSLLSDQPPKTARLNQQFAGVLEVRCLGLDAISREPPDRWTVVDVRLQDASFFTDLRDWLKRKPKDGKAVFLIDKSSRIEVTRAYALGATAILNRPLDPKELTAALLGDFAALAGDRSALSPQDAPGAVAAVDTLQHVFGAVSLGEALDRTVIDAASSAVVGDIESKGLASWIETVRKHHSQTFQHCLLVTGVAVAFGKSIGLSRADKQRLAFAGMAHDVGKARIPLAILEMPGPLDQDELAVMRQHPVLGAESIQGQPDIAPETLDIVLHHHEMLDGSGYPHGLKGSEISDIVRLMTISDIFGALIERRSYKPPLTNAAAYQILLDMGPKLDTDLVRAFQPTTQLDRFGSTGDANVF